MPSFNRLLILSVLALATSVNSAPAQSTDPSHSVVATEGGLLPAPGVNQGDVLAASSANDVDGVDSEDIDDHAFDKKDTHLDNEYAGSPILQPRAPADLKLVFPKTTKAKTTAKATAIRPTKTANTPTKASSATGTTKPSGVRCPTKKPAKRHGSFTSRAYDYIASLFKRDGQEFIGWHGTNSNTAAFWKSVQGQVKKPPAGGSGAGALLGPGLYVTDDRETAITYAMGNAANNKGTTPSLCAIFASSSANWRVVIRKAFIPEALKGSSDQREAQRITYIQGAVPGVHAETVVKFAIYDAKSGVGEMAIPSSDLTEKLGHFVAKCFTVDPKTAEVVVSDRAASNAGTSSFPRFNYNGATLRKGWNIALGKGVNPPACN